MKRILDLYCGAGGFSCGFALLEKGDRFVGIDIWKTALETYAGNIPNCETMNESVCDLDVSTLGKFDIIIGSPPCQPFSGVNLYGDRSFDASEIRVFLKIVEEIKPRWWVMEESPFASFAVSDPRYISANEHGLYHLRRRLFAGNYPRVRVTLMRKVIHPTPVAQEMKAFNKNKKHAPDARSCCQYFGRRLSSWELQVLMGFPPAYNFRGTYNERCIQIGNAVCPPVARAVYKAIIAREKRDFWYN